MDAAAGDRLQSRAAERSSFPCSRLWASRVPRVPGETARDRASWSCTTTRAPAALAWQAGLGIVAGSDKQFDVRIAEASACTRDSLGRLIFGASQQVSRYALNAAPNANGQHEIVKRAGLGYTSVNRPYPMFCGGGCAFSGDYLHLIPRVPYVQVGTSWRLTTATGVNQNTLPAPVLRVCGPTRGMSSCPEPIQRRPGCGPTRR